MSLVEVHPRIARRHPEIRPRDVMDAMRSMVAYQKRGSGEWCAVGFDSGGRFLEMVYAYNESTDSFLVYHAMTPPSGKTLRELRMER